jgi:hypothetical protein
VASSSSTLIFKIDMNSVRGNEVGTLLTHAIDPALAQMERPEVGDFVLALDDEGNQCGAYVRQVSGKWLGLRLDWDMWMPGLQFEPTVSPSLPSTFSPPSIQKSEPVSASA